MGWLTGIFKAINGFMDMFRTKEDQIAGLNKGKVAQYEKRDEIRKGADRIKRNPDRNRMQRNKGKDGK